MALRVSLAHRASTVLVTGAYGRVGKAAVAHLAQKAGSNFNIRATVTPTGDYKAKGEYLRSIGANEVVTFDLKDKSTWAPTLEGVDRVFSSSGDALIEQHMDFARFLGERKAQIKHVVRISCFGADTNTNSYDAEKHSSVEGAAIPLMLQHYWWSEQVLVEAGLPTTTLRGNFYMNHLLKNEIKNIAEHGFFSSPLANCKNSFVCTNDQGEAAATCLIEGPERHANKFYDITGPQAQSMHEIAEDLSRAYGKKVEYRPQDVEQFEKDFGKARADFFEYLRNGFYTRCSPDFYNLHGRKATSYHDYLTQKGPFGETGLEELFSSAGAIFTKGVDAFAHLKDVKK